MRSDAVISMLSPHRDLTPEAPVDYHNRHVVVTGGTGALGKAVVGALVEAGAVCHVPFLTVGETGHLPWHGHDQVRLVGPLQLTDEIAVARLYGEIPDLWASIHLAGGFAMAPMRASRKSDLMRQLDLNVVTAFLCCAAAVSVMSGRDGGRIVNVAARVALEWRAGCGMAAYAASKAAVAALTVALAEEAAEDGILVNAVAPSIVDTPANRLAMPQADHSVWPKVEEVAATILYLASPQNRAVRGGVVPVYGRS